MSGRKSPILPNMDQNRKKPCRFYLSKGGCKFSAEKCRFSHEGRPPNRNSSALGRRSLYGFLQNQNPFTSQFAMISFIYAIHNHENKSTILSLLAHEEKFGLKRIREIAGASIGDGTFHVQHGSFKTSISFQKTIVPLLRVLTSPLMTASLEAHAYNAILSAVVEAPNFLRNVRASIKGILQSGKISGAEEGTKMRKEPEEGTLEPQNWFDILHPLSIFLRECMDRFRSLQHDEEFLKFTDHFLSWVKRCVSTDKIFVQKKYENELNNAVMPLRRRIENIRHDEEIAKRIRMRQADPAACIPDTFSHVAITLDGPGEFSSSGNPRHDNDFADYTKIEILPSWNEVMCMDAPYLPKPGIPSPHVDDGALQVLDTQFRLIRENLTGPLRRGLRMLLREMDSEERKSFVRAGRFVSRAGQGNETRFDVYCSVRIEQVCKQVRMLSAHGIVFQAAFKWPRNLKKFEPKVSRRLSNTSLVAIVLQVGEENHVCFATIASRNFDKRNEPTVCLALCGPERKKNTELMLTALLAESPPEILMLQATSVAYFNYGPVLEALKGLRNDLPFSDVLKYGRQEHSNVSPPSYVADLEGYIDLSLLLPADSQATKEDRMRLQKANVLTENLNELSRLLTSCTTMDLAQSKFLLSALSRSVFVGQGPPGTGKSFIGCKIAEVILRNHPEAQKIGVKNTSGKASKGYCSKRPLVCITYTNHALDQFLSGLVSSGISNIIRIGRTSQDSSQSKEKAYISSRELREVERNFQSERRVLGHFWREMNQASEKIQIFLSRLLEVRDSRLSWSTLEGHLSFFYPHHHQSFLQRDLTSVQDSEGFQYIFGSKKSRSHFFEMWIRGDDPLEELKIFREEILHGDDDRTEEKEHLGKAQDESAPTRSIENLLLEDNVWDTSLAERKSLIRHWKTELNRMNEEEFKDSLDRLNSAHVRVKELAEESSLEILKEAAVVGMTTTTAAKNQKLMKALGAKVVIIEEAAEVLESHILASLNEHTDHIIMIGDHKQLRPRIESYELSTDANRGFKIDTSLFERLASAKYPVETLITQRRMRPEISSLIRETIYPDLADHASTQRFHLVRGVCHNMYFIDHRYPEDGELQGHSAAHITQLEQKKSHANKFEADFAVKFARYLVQQGYDDENIAILTPYVGQLLLLRDALQASFVVKYSEKDLELLEESGLIEESGLNEEKLTSNSERARDPLMPAGSRNYTVRSTVRSMIRVSSIDNFQGEEADVVIICLVRSNSEGNIGFVKSPNRANVLLSRARKGMYLIGNSAVFRKSPMWTKVIHLMQEQDKIGSYLELRCSQHEEQKTLIRTAEDFSRVRDGGCSRNCAFRMSCGHTCPRRCHPDDPQHKGAYCNKPCTRLRSEEECPYRHPCPKVCGDECGQCRELLHDIKLPCGHMKSSAECWQVSRGLKNLPCDTKVVLTIPECRHQVKLTCSLTRKGDSNPLVLMCTASCGQPLECGHNCSKKCGSCWARGVKSGARSQDEESFLEKNHGECTEKCKRRQLCGHLCNMPCHTPEECKPCKKKCEEFCEHSKCGRTCEVSCSACIEPCTWFCEHEGRCPLPCGAPCDRVPCDLRCVRKLKCGHQCPSVCGEPCPSAEWCHVCSAESTKRQQMDLMNLTEYKDIDCETDPIIILDCNHGFTVSSLDGLEMACMGEGPRIGPTSSDMNSTEFLCPSCRTPIRRVKRYGRVHKKSLLNLNSAKHDKRLRGRMAILEKMWESNLLKKVRDQSERTKAELDKGLELLRNLFKGYKDMSRMLSEHPRVRLYSAAYSHLKRAEASADGLSGKCNVEEYKKKLLSIRPDFTPKIQILHGKARIFQHFAIISILKQLKIESHKIAECDATLTDEKYKDVLSLVEQKRGKGKQSAFEKSVLFFDEAERTALSGKNTIRARFLRCQKIENYLLRIDSIFLLAARYEKLESSFREAQLQLYNRLEKEVQEALESALRKESGWNCQDLEDSVRTLKKLGSERLKMIKRRIEGRAFYSEVSTEEREAVISAALTATSGRWNERIDRGSNMYECPNHHVYFIGECGGAMERGVCPECEEPIGGEWHVLDPSNFRASF